MARTSAPSGMEEITSVHGWRSSTPLCAAVTAIARPSACSTFVTAASNSIVVPASVTISAQRSHIIPGPYFG